MADLGSKKTLGIKSGTLKMNTGEKLAVPNNTGFKSSTSTTSGKGKVVVVTKSSRAFNKNVPSNDQINNGFSNTERNRKLQLIQQAAIQKRREEESRTKILEQSNVEAPISQVEESKNLNVEENIEEKQNIPVRAQPPIRKINLDDLLRKGKVKNLNELYRATRPVVATEEEKSDSAITTQNITNTSKVTLENTASKPSFPLKTPLKRNLSEAEDVVNNVNKKEEEQKFNRKITLTEAMMMDSESSSQVGFKRRSLASIIRARGKIKRKLFGDQQKPAEKIIREVNIPDFISVQELASRMAEKPADVVKSLMNLGMMVTVNQLIDADTAELVVSEYGHKLKRVTEAQLESTLLQKVEDKAEELIHRSPVVTIMGHVDHGKTSLLDALRNTDVVAGEAGGITQHIGAYQITLQDGKMITFLDTPGHEAFTAMRMRGAKVTDIVVLVVAADDGIKQQTIEAISHAKAAEVPILVAINKIDKPEANSQKVKNELFSHNIVPEDMGGDTIVIEVSAKQKINLDKLEESILLQAEFLDLKANPNRTAEGTIVEAKVDKGRGVIATLLVQNGTIKIGDIVVAGSTWGKIKALTNDKGQAIKSAGPSSPIEIFGLTNAPVAGDECVVVPNEKTARDLVNLRLERDKQRKLVATKSITLDNLFKRAQIGGLKELHVIIKGDVQGSVEAIINSLQKLSTEEIAVKVLHSAVGGITESDVTLASASNAIIIGFNVRASQQARDMARNFGIDIKYYSIIYNLVDEIRAAMGGMLSPSKKEEITGYTEVRQVIDLTKYGKIAGCYVTEGNIKRSSQVRLIRDSVVIYEGKLKALKRFKDDVKEVNAGFECGISFENYEDIKVGDKIEAFDVTEHARTI